MPLVGLRETRAKRGQVRTLQRTGLESHKMTNTDPWESKTIKIMVFRGPERELPLFNVYTSWHPLQAKTHLSRSNLCSQTATSLRICHSVRRQICKTTSWKCCKSAGLVFVFLVVLHYLTFMCFSLVLMVLFSHYYCSVPVDFYLHPLACIVLFVSFISSIASSKSKPS